MVHFAFSSTSPGAGGRPGAGGIETKASTAQLGLEAGTGAELGNYKKQAGAELRQALNSNCLCMYVCVGFVTVKKNAAVGFRV